MRRKTYLLAVATMILTAAAPALGAATPGQRCQAGKNTGAGAYAACLQKAQAKFATSLDGAKLATDVARCDQKLLKSFTLAESKAIAQGGSCPSVGDVAAVQGALGEQSETLADAFGGDGSPAAPAARPLVTGQQRCFSEVVNFGEIPCPGTGQDAEFQAGVARSYFDDGVGTVRDARTGLVWEKQSDDNLIHDRDFAYTLTGAAAKISTLNFAAYGGHTDWRLPNRFELETLLDLDEVGPATDPSFNVSCITSCSTLTCSCTANATYWTSTSVIGLTGFQWVVDFAFGQVTPDAKSSSHRVRAVRGGL